MKRELFVERLLEHAEDAVAQAEFVIDTYSLGSERLHRLGFGARDVTAAHIQRPGRRFAPALEFALDGGMVLCPLRFHVMTGWAVGFVHPELGPIELHGGNFEHLYASAIEAYSARSTVAA